MNIKVDFDNIVVKEDKNDFNIKVLMLKGEKGEQGDGENNIIEKVQVNGTDLPVTNKTVNVLIPIVDNALSSSSINPVQNKVINDALGNKADVSALDNYYEISEVDNLLDDKADASTLGDYYKKTETYSQGQTNSLLNSKADATAIDTINSTLSTKANSNDVANIYETKEDHNASISSLATQISSLASGSPLVASSISGMIDTTKVYVNTTDGYWYYYDGSNWVQGGVYQAVEDSDTVNLIKRNEKSNLKNLYNQVNFNLNAFDGEYSHTFYNASNGTPGGNNTRYLSNVNLIDLTGINKFEYEYENVVGNATNGIFFLFYNNDTFISYVMVTSNLKGIISVPTNANKLRFEIAFTNNIDVHDSNNIIIRITNEETTREKFEKLDKNILFNKKIEEIQKFIGTDENITLIADCMNNNGNYVDLTGLNIQSFHSVVNVEENECYHVIGSGNTYYPPIIILDENNNIIANYFNLSGDTRTEHITIDYVVKIPSNASKMVINTFYNYIKLKSLEYKNVGLTVFPKSKYIAFGDSVSRGNHPDATKSQYAWPEMFGNMCNLETINLSHGGQGYLNTSFYSQTALQTIQATDISDANLITLSFGMNDQSASIGEITDTGTNTVMGMVYNCINYIQTNNNKCQLIIIGTTKANGYYGTALTEINTKLKAICEKYAIAFIDTHDQPFNQFNGTTSGSLTTDGVHFNDDGYLLLAQYMTAKLSSLYGLK